LRSGNEVLQTANHYSAGVEQRFGESTRFRTMFFDREGDTSMRRNRPHDCIPIFPPHGFVGFQHSHSRGVQVVLQSRTANRLAGWIGYTLTYARESNLLLHPDGTLYWSLYFPTLADQRHTLNVFRQLSGQSLGTCQRQVPVRSGFPIPNGDNSIRLGDYQRLDVRAEKDWAFKHWKLALYGEVLNITNQTIPDTSSLRLIRMDGQQVDTGQGLPITPTAGVAFEF